MVRYSKKHDLIREQDRGGTHTHTYFRLGQDRSGRQDSTEQDRGRRRAVGAARSRQDTGAEDGRHGGRAERATQGRVSEGTSQC